MKHSDFYRKKSRGQFDIYENFGGAGVKLTVVSVILSRRSGEVKYPPSNSLKKP